jgi:hypothetical protein
VDGADVYWTNTGGLCGMAPPGNDGAVMKVGKGGGAPIVLASGQQGPTGLAVDDAFVYWANAGVH